MNDDGTSTRGNYNIDLAFPRGVDIGEDGYLYAYNESKVVKLNNIGGTYATLASYTGNFLNKDGKDVALRGIHAKNANEVWVSNQGGSDGQNTIHKISLTSNSVIAYSAAGYTVKVNTNTNANLGTLISSNTTPFKFVSSTGHPSNPGGSNTMFTATMVAEYWGNDLNNISFNGISFKYDKNTKIVYKNTGGSPLPLCTLTGDWTSPIFTITTDTSFQKAYPILYGEKAFYSCALDGSDFNKPVNKASTNSMVAYSGNGGDGTTNVLRKYGNSICRWEYNGNTKQTVCLTEDEISGIGNKYYVQDDGIYKSTSIANSSDKVKVKLDTTLPSGTNYKFSLANANSQVNLWSENNWNVETMGNRLDIWDGGLWSTVKASVSNGSTLTLTQNGASQDFTVTGVYDGGGWGELTLNADTGNFWAPAGKVGASNFAEITDHSLLDGTHEINLASLISNYSKTANLWYKIELLGDSGDNSKTPIINSVKIYTP